MPTRLRAATVIIIAAVLGGVGTWVYTAVHDGLTDKFQVYVEADPDKIITKTGPVGGSYVVAKPVQAIGAPPNNANTCIGRYKWAHGLGGIDADSTSARVTVEGSSDDIVQITGITPRITVASPPAVGSHLTCPGRGGAAEILSVTIDLDTDPPAVLTADKTGAAVPFLFTVGKGQAETFDISAVTNKCDCQWTADLELSVDGKTETYPIEVKGGKGFRTTSSLNAKMYQWINGAWTDVAAETQPSSPVLPPDGLPQSVPDICALAAPLAMPLLVHPVKTTLDAAAVRLGAAQLPLRHSGCSYASAAVPTGSLPPGGTMNDSINVWLDGAKGPDDAQKELKALVKGYSSNAPPAQASAATYLFPGVFVAAKGRLVLTVQASSNDAAFEKNAEVLGAALLKRIP